MGIDAHLEDEDGNSLGSVPDVKNSFAQTFHDYDKSGTVCLRFIDPHGDTTFNALQFPELISELQAMRSTAGQEARSSIEDVLELTNRAQGDVHLYVKFCGD